MTTDTRLSDEVLAELLAHTEANTQGRTHLTNPTVAALVREVQAARAILSRLKRLEDGDSMARWPDELYSEVAKLTGEAS